MHEHVISDPVSKRRKTFPCLRPKWFQTIRLQREYPLTGTNGLWRHGLLVHFDNIAKYVLILNGTQRKLRNHFVPRTLYETLQAKKMNFEKLQC